MKNYFICSILLALFLLISSKTAQSQKSEANDTKESIKLGRILSIHRPEELFADAYDYYKNFGGSFAAKLCSVDSLPIAYGLSAARLKIVPRDLDRLLNTPQKSISLFLYQGGCISGDEETTAIELWWTPDEGKTIKFDKRFEDCQFKRSYYGDLTDKGFKNDKKYTAALKELKKEVRAVSDNSKHAGLVTGVYYNHYTEALRRRIELAKTLLAEEIKEGLITVKISKNDIPYISEEKRLKLKEKEYPDVFAVRFVENGCSEPKK